MNAILEQINSTGKIFVGFALPMLVQSAVLVLILLLADFALRKKVRAVFRYWIWMLVLLKLILPISLSTPVSFGYLFGDQLAYVDISRANTEAETMTEAQTMEPAPAVISPILDLSRIEVDRNPTAVTSIIPIPDTEPPVVQQAIVQPVNTQALSVTPLSWQGVVFLLWLAAVMTMGLLLLQRAIFVRGLLRQAYPANNLMNEALEYCRKRMGVKSKVSLKISVNATSPAVCGLFRPVILLPRNLGPTLGSSHLQTVLMHELAHIKRGDLWINMVQTALQIIYLYNPLLWLANAMIRRVREQAVDETVLVAMGSKAQQYPETLLNVARLAWQRPALSLRLIGVIESKSQLKERIRKMLERPVPKNAKLGIVGMLIVFALGAFLLPMAKADNSPADTSAVGEKSKTQTETGLKMLQEQITQLQRQLQQLQQQIIQEKQKAAIEEALTKDQREQISQLQRLLQQMLQEKRETPIEKALTEEQEEQMSQLQLLLQQIIQESPQTAKDKDLVKELLLRALARQKKTVRPDKVDKSEISAPKPQWLPPLSPVHPEEIKLPAKVKLPRMPTVLPKIELPPTVLPEIKLPAEQISESMPKLEPPKETIQQLSTVMAEKASLEQEIGKLRKELKRKQQLGDISDEQAKELDNKIKALEQRLQQLGPRSEELTQQIEAWSQRVSEKMADWGEKIRERVKQKFEDKREKELQLFEQQMKQYEQRMKQYEQQHEDKYEKELEQYKRQMKEFERQMDQYKRQHEDKYDEELMQFERQMERFEHQMEQWSEQFKHQMEQWAEQLDFQMEFSFEQLQDELDVLDDVVVEITDDSKKDDQGLTFQKGPNEFTVPLTEGKKIVVKSRVGSVKVYSGKAGQCKCTTTVKARAKTTEQARQKAEPVKVEVDDDAKTLTLTVVNPDNDQWNNINVELDIQVPENTDIIVTNDVGNISVTDLKGKIEGTTGVGDITISDIQGDIQFKTNVGKIVCDLPDNISAEVAASTNVGSIKTELPLKVIRSNITSSRASGMLGQGDNKVELSANVGSIIIR